MKTHLKVGTLFLLLSLAVSLSGCGLLWFGAGAATGAAVDDDDKTVVVEKD
jgi:hypothetical protein